MPTRINRLCTPGTCRCTAHLETEQSNLRMSRGDSPAERSSSWRATAPPPQFAPACPLPPPSVPADEKPRRHIPAAAAPPPGGMLAQRRRRRRAEDPRTTRSLLRGGSPVRCWSPPPPLSAPRGALSPVLKRRRGEAGYVSTGQLRGRNDRDGSRGKAGVSACVIPLCEPREIASRIGWRVRRPGKAALAQRTSRYGSWGGWTKNSMQGTSTTPGIEIASSFAVPIRTGPSSHDQQRTRPLCSALDTTHSALVFHPTSAPPTLWTGFAAMPSYLVCSPDPGGEDAVQRAGPRGPRIQDRRRRLRPRAESSGRGPGSQPLVPGGATARQGTAWNR